MSTRYLVKTNGVEACSYTSKTRAIAEAETLGKAADERGMGDVITVETERTGKCVFTYTAPRTEAYVTSAESAQAVVDAYMGNADVDEIAGMLTGELRDAFFVQEMDMEDVIALARTIAKSPIAKGPQSAQSDECTCSKGEPSPGNRPCLHCGGDNSWCAKHYPAPQTTSEPLVHFGYNSESVECGQGQDTPYGSICTMVLSDVTCGDCLTSHKANNPMTENAPAVPSKGYVGVRQNVPGFQGVEHVHAEGCRDIAREMKRWGQKKSDTFPYASTETYATITFENWADIASDNYADPFNERAAWDDMLSWMQDDHSGIRIMPCASSLPLGETPFGPIAHMENGYVIIEPVTQSGVAPCACGECFDDTMHSDLSKPELCDACQEAGCWNAQDDMGGTCQRAALETFTQTCLTCGEVKPSDSEWNEKVVYCADCTAAGKHLDTRSSEDMADTMTTPVHVEVSLSLMVDGIMVNLGWHTFTLNGGQTEYDIPAMYGERHGEWKRPGKADWASVITVDAIDYL